MEQALRIARALADESRLRALAALRTGDLCLSQMVHVLELSPSTVSKHMDVLVQAGLVEVKREGKWRYYRLPHLVGGGLSRRALAWALAGLRPLDHGSAETVRAIQARCRPREELTACYRS